MKRRGRRGTEGGKRGRGGDRVRQERDKWGGRWGRECDEGLGRWRRAGHCSSCSGLLTCRRNGRGCSQFVFTHFLIHCCSANNPQCKLLIYSTILWKKKKLRLFAICPGVDQPPTLCSSIFSTWQNSRNVSQVLGVYRFSLQWQEKNGKWWCKFFNWLCPSS